MARLLAIFLLAAIASEGGGLAAAQAASGGGGRSAAEFAAVPSFTVVTSARTTQRLLGVGLPPQYDTHVPPLGELTSRYLAAAQTLAFVDAEELPAFERLPRSSAGPTIVAPGTVLSAAQGEQLLQYAAGGGAVILSGGAGLYDEDDRAVTGGFGATPLGAALGLKPLRRLHANVSATNVSRSSNPEWFRLLTPQKADGQLMPLGTAQLEQVASPAADTGPILLATATTTEGAVLPLVVAKRVACKSCAATGAGWLVWLATSDATLIERAVDFVLAATGVFLNPGAGGQGGHSPIALTSSSSVANTAVISFSAPADPAASLQGSFRVTLLAAPNSTTCVQALDNWWGDSPPSHTLTNVSHSADVSVKVEVSYAGMLACATISAQPSARPWFEVRTTAHGALHGFCRSSLDCELNGHCSAGARGGK
jgi:hypothetical protein